MLAAQRQAQILQEVNQRGAAKIADLAQFAGVSEMTVRRDLDYLADQGLLDKVHGGATAIVDTSSVSEPPFKAKSLREQTAKSAIAEQASTLATSGSSVALMGGSSVYAMAPFLVDIPWLTVLTNSLPVSDYFQREGRADQTVILTGGIRTPTDSFVGEITISVFDKLNVDIAFMGTHGMDLRGGFSSPNILEAETNRAIRQHAKQTVILADHTKWGQVGFATFAQLNEADVIVTDDGISTEALAALQTHIHRVIVAQPNFD
jgi:DeoR/GlpR family transcriptional regulator of sugar metabolism